MGNKLGTTKSPLDRLAAAANDGGDSAEDDKDTSFDGEATQRPPATEHHHLRK